MLNTHLMTSRLNDATKKKIKWFRKYHQEKTPDSQGLCRSLAWGGDNPEYSYTPYFDSRRTIIRQRRMTQILIDCLGSYIWINVNFYDLVNNGDPI